MQLNQVLTYLSFGLVGPALCLLVVLYGLMLTGFGHHIEPAKRRRTQNRILVMVILLGLAMYGHANYIEKGVLLATMSLLAYSVLFLTPLGGMEIAKPAKYDWQSRLVYVTMFLPLAAAFFSSMLLARN